MLNCHKICKGKLAKSDATHKYDHDYGNHGNFVKITKTFKITHFVSCMTQEIISYHFWKILFQLINFTQCYSFLAHKSARNWPLSSPWLNIFLFSHWISTDYAQFDLPYQFWPPNPFMIHSNQTSNDDKVRNLSFDVNFTMGNVNHKRI